MPAKKSNKTAKKKVQPQNKTNQKVTKKQHTGVQAHGQMWEEQVVGVLVSPQNMDQMQALSYTAVHDIPKSVSKTGRNVSVKATKNKTVGFGDALRTITNLKKDSPLEAVVISYDQLGPFKQPSKVTRLDLTNAKHILLGTSSSDDINDIVNEVRKLDSMVKKGDPAYKKAAVELRRKMADSYLSVAPKIGNPSKKRAGRLQIVLRDVNRLATEHPQLVIHDEHCHSIDGCLGKLAHSARSMQGKKS
tara:strand:+ start:150 stop:890 length:741 start_codon:yes stop_codon:yes gene_type:complete